MSKFRHANETGFAFLLAAFFLSGCPSEGGADDEVGDTGDGGAAELEYGDGGRSACGDDEVPDEDCGVDPGHCSGGDLEGHLSRARPNMNLLPPLVVAEATPELSFRLFGVGSDFQILSASVEVHNGGVVSADGDLLGSTIVSEDLLSPPAPGQDPSVINASVLAPLEIGANFIEIEVAYSGGWTHRLIAAVVRDDGALPPTIFHLASEHGSLGDTALVGQTVTITGFGFGATQMIEGTGVGSVSFGGGAAGQERDAGTVYLWGPNRIVVEVPAGSSERQSGGRGVVVRDAVGLSSASWDFAISPRLLDDPSCEVSFSQFAGEELFAPDLRYTKDADARDFDQDGDVDIFSSVSHATNLTEDLDRLHLNQINGERDFSFTGPLTFNQTATRYNNDDGDGWCGIDDHSPRGQGPAAYESGVADFDNDGDLDILDPPWATDIRLRGRRLPIM